ncbi:MAG: hypothetical protein ACOVO1_01555, partial [Chitinophagaceae bacterium]
FEVISTQKVVVPGVDTTKENIAKINAATSLDELKTIYTEIPIEQKNNEVVSAKDAMKAKLTPNE